MPNFDHRFLDQVIAQDGAADWTDKGEGKALNDSERSDESRQKQHLPYGEAVGDSA